jgi:hypothetical protein
MSTNLESLDQTLLNNITNKVILYINMLFSLCWHLIFGKVNLP